MLLEIVCDKFKQQRVEFHNGLNVVLGDDQGSNSIGKSSFLMIIDFIYGGKDYIKKSVDIQKNVGQHIIKFAFKFSGNVFYFSRDTENTETVNVCDSSYNVCSIITVEQYMAQLKELYGFSENEISFRDAVGRYLRIYGRENTEEKRPLDAVHNERTGQPITALLKLCDLYQQVKEIDELAKKKNDELKTFKAAQKYHFIDKIGKKQRKENEKQLTELELEKKKITEELNDKILEFDTEKSEMILKLRRELSILNRRIRAQKIRIIPLEENLSGTRKIKKEDVEKIKKFFPEVDLRKIEEIEDFHKEIDSVLQEEIKEEITNIQNIIRLLEEDKESVAKRIKEISETENLSQVILFKFAEIQKQIEMLNIQNSYYDKREILDNERKDAEERRETIRNQQISRMQNMINIKMEELNDIIYEGTKVAPTLSISKNQYVFETPDDTGTGTCYRGMVLYDLSILQLTCLPILVHDSVVLKQIEDIAIEKILEFYDKSEKQVFISLDKVSSYSKRSQEILKENRVLQLGIGGNELFGRSWSKK